MRRLLIFIILVLCAIGLLMIIGAGEFDDKSEKTIEAAHFDQNSIPLEALLSKGDANGLGVYFANEVMICTPDTEEELPKVAAIKALNQFFKANPPTSFKFIHQGQSPKGINKYQIGQLITKKTTFRTSVMTNMGMIEELRFEK